MTTINPPCREPYITFYSLLTNDVSMKIATGVTKTTWRTVGLFLLTFVLVVLLQPAGALGLMMLVDSSGGLINPTLLNGTFGILILVGGVVLWYGSLAPRDIGIVPKKLPRAVGLTAGFWFLFTAAQAVYGFTVGDLSLHPDVTGQEAITTVGLALGYIVGNAPFEELAFRGFLLVQLYLLLDGEWWQLNPSTRIVTAIIGSSLPFTLLHIPVVVLGDAGVGLWYLGLIFLNAVLLCLVYIRTQNIFLAIGIHALANFPLPILAVHEQHALAFQFTWLIPAAVVVLLWPKLWNDYD